MKDEFDNTSTQGLIEEKNKFRFHRLKRFAETWIDRNLNAYSENSSLIRSIKGPQDYLDFLSLILLGHKQQMEDYFQIKDINLKIEKLIHYLPVQGPFPQGKILAFRQESHIPPKEY